MHIYQALGGRLLRFVSAASRSLHSSRFYHRLAPISSDLCATPPNIALKPIPCIDARTLCAGSDLIVRSRCRLLSSTESIPTGLRKSVDGKISSGKSKVDNEFDRRWLQAGKEFDDTPIGDSAKLPIPASHIGGSGEGCITSRFVGAYTPSADGPAQGKDAAFIELKPVEGRHDSRCETRATSISIEHFKSLTKEA